MHTAIPDKTWATELGTTRATLSRVLKKLEAEGLVVIRHGWGAFVAQAPEDTEGRQPLDAP